MRRVSHDPYSEHYVEPLPMPPGERHTEWLRVKALLAAQDAERRRAHLAQAGLTEPLGAVRWFTPAEVAAHQQAIRDDGGLPDCDLTPGQRRLALRYGVNYACPSLGDRDRRDAADFAALGRGGRFA